MYEVGRSGVETSSLTKLFSSNLLKMASFPLQLVAFLFLSFPLVAVSVTIESENGELNATLVVETTVCNSCPFEFITRSYNGTIPGPTFIVRPGDVVRIKLINDLGANDGALTPLNSFHDANITNLHLHGPHVDPNEDDVFLKVLSEGDFHQYVYHIPNDHAPGTHWYHPHHHGSGSLQIKGGLAGAFVVEDSLKVLNLSDYESSYFFLQFFCFEDFESRQPQFFDYAEIAEENGDGLPIPICSGERGV